MAEGTRDARTGRADGERTRERILEIALPLFAAHGYAGTSIRKVAHGADVNVATLAYHFVDKQGLYDTVVQRLHEDLVANWPEAGLPVDAADPVAWIVDTAWSFVRAHELHVRLLLRHVVDGGGLPDVVAARWTEPLMSRADQLVALFQPAWSVVDRRMLVLTVMHLVVRLVLEDRRQLAVMLGNPPDLDDAVRGWLVRMLRRELGLS